MQVELEVRRWHKVHKNASYYSQANPRQRLAGVRPPVTERRLTEIEFQPDMKSRMRDLVPWIWLSVTLEPSKCIDQFARNAATTNLMLWDQNIRIETEPTDRKSKALLLSLHGHVFLVQPQFPLSGRVGRGYRIPL